MSNIKKLEALAIDNGALNRIKARVKNRKWLKHSQNIALRIWEEMEEQHLSQKQLALKTGVSPQYINKVLKGKEKLNLETIAKLEEALDISLIEVR